MRDTRDALFLFRHEKGENIVSYLRSIQPKPPVPQSQPLNARQSRNNAGGYSYSVDKWQQLERFLLIGTLSGTYYVGEDKLTEQNLDVVKELIYEDGQRVVRTCMGVSVEGRAPSMSPALLVLAMCASVAPVPMSQSLGGSQSDAEYLRLVRMSALTTAQVVCRTASMLMEFVAYCKQLRGWGRGLRNLVAQWYTQRSASDLAYQMVKYRERRGYSHRDLLMLGHPKLEGDKAQLAKWVLQKPIPLPADGPVSYAMEYISAFNRVQSGELAVAQMLSLVERYKLPFEAVPNTEYSRAALWETMLPNMPLNAAMRNLSRMAGLGVLATGKPGVDALIAKLHNEEAVKKSRLHPFRILYAIHAVRISGSAVNPRLYDALNYAFELSFGNVPASGKRILLGIDISGSMKGSFATVRNPGKNAQRNAVDLSMACAAMALMVLRVEKHSEVIGFGTRTRDLPISASSRLDDAINIVRRADGGGTDCAQPIEWARENGREFDAIVILTDNETWQGHTHPSEAMEQYRRASAVSDCRLIVVAMAPTPYTSGDPADELSMNIVGFDANTPALISAYLGGAVDSNDESELS